MDSVSDSKLCELEQRSDETEVDCVKRLKESLEFQSIELQGLVAINGIMTESLATTGGVSVEKLKQDHSQTCERLELVRSELAAVERNATADRELCEGLEEALKDNFNHVDGVASSPIPDSKAEVKESEAEVNKLLACIAEEQSKVEKLSGRLDELGEDVDELLEHVGDESEDNAEIPQEEEEEEEEENEVAQESEEVDEDDDALPEEDEENEVEVGPPEEGEEVEEDNDGLPQEDEEDEVDAEPPQESEAVEVDAEEEENGDRIVERLLHRISNGKVAEDRRNAMEELVRQLAFTFDRTILMAFHVKGFPVVMNALKEARDDEELAEKSLRVLYSALAFVKFRMLQEEEARTAFMNADTLSRDADSISLILSFTDILDELSRYLPLLVLTVLVTVFPNRLPETLLATPNAITRLLDMLTKDKFSIQRHVTVFLDHLTHQSEEFKKFVVSEGVLEKIMSILEIGDSLSEDFFKLLNNLLLKNAANQKQVLEKKGFGSLFSVFKVEVTEEFFEHKACSVLAGLKTIEILITEDSESDPVTKATLVQENIFAHLLNLAIHCQTSPVSVRCSALRCIGDLIHQHPKNIEALSSKTLGEEPALNSILRFLFTTSEEQEFVAAVYVFKNLCEKNPEGQAMLASTLVSQSHPVDDGSNISFGSVLLRGFSDLETSCRASSILAYILEANNQLKKKVLEIKLDGEPLMQLIVKHLCLSSFVRYELGEPPEPVNSYFQPIFLKLLAIWLADCPDAVKYFLDSRPGLTYILRWLSDESESARTKGLAAVILGQCVIFNELLEGLDAFAVARVITCKFGLSSYFLTLNGANDQIEDNLVLASIFDSDFSTLVKKLEADIRERLEELSNQPNSNEPAVPAELEQNSGETEIDYINRLKESVSKQCTEIQGLIASNAAMAEELGSTGGFQLETILRDLREKPQEVKQLKLKKDRIEADGDMYRELWDVLETAFPDTDGVKAKARTNSLSAWLGREKSKAAKLSKRLSELGEDVEKLLESNGNVVVS